MDELSILVASVVWYHFRSIYRQAFSAVVGAPVDSDVATPFIVTHLNLPYWSGVSWLRWQSVEVRLNRNPGATGGRLRGSNLLEGLVISPGAPLLGNANGAQGIFEALRPDPPKKALVPRDTVYLDTLRSAVLGVYRSGRRVLVPVAVSRGGPWPASSSLREPSPRF